MTDLTEIEDAITTHLSTITTHWDALMVPPGGTGAGGSRSTLITADDHDPTGADIDRTTRVVSLRRFATDVLNGWSRVVMEDRPVTQALPDGTSVPSMAGFLTTHAQWASGHEAAQDMVDELADLARQVSGLAVPRKREWVSLGSCPLPLDSEEPTICAGQVRAWPRAEDRDGEVMARCQSCGTEAVATWWESRMFDDAELKIWLTDADLVTFVHRTFGKVIVEATIRQWVKRGVLEASGRDEKGRRLFHREAVVYALDRHEKRERTGT